MFLLSKSRQGHYDLGPLGGVLVVAFALSVWGALSGSTVMIAIAVAVLAVSIIVILMAREG